MSLVSRNLRLTAIVGMIAVAAAVTGTVAVRPHAPSPAVPLAQPAAAAQAAAPENDNFERRAAFVPPISPPWLVNLPFEGTQDARGATLEPGEGSPCASISSSVWYGFYPDTGGSIVVDTIGSDYDTAVAVYTFDPNGNFIPSPPGGNLLALDCSDNASGAQSRVRFEAQQYREYFIQIGSVGSAGTLRINAKCDPACPPRNDDREYIEYIGLDVYQPAISARVDTTAATTQADEPRSCGNAGKTVWYAMSFWSSPSRRVIIDTAGSNFGTTIAVYSFGDFTIPSPPGGLTQYACESGGQARVAVDLQGQREYFIQVGGVDGASGDLRIRFACDGPCPPYQDAFNSGYGSAPLHTEIPIDGATVQPGERTDCGNMSHTVWYGIYTEGPTTVTIDTSKSDFDTAVAVYDDPQYAYDVAQLQRIACDEGGAGQRASLRIPMVAQSPVWVQVGGRNGDAGLLVLDIDCDPAPCPPPYDAQNNPNWLYVPSYLPWYDGLDTRGATEEPGEPLSCGNMGSTVWYFLETSGSARIHFSTLNSSFATALALYEVGDTLDLATEADRIACADGNAQPAELTFDVEQGKRYRVQVGGRNGASGDVQIEINCVPACPPQNDNMGNGMYISGNASGTIDTRGATRDAGEPQPCGGARNVGKTVWFWIGETLLSTDGPQTATWRVSTSGSDFPTMVATYSGDGFSPPGGASEAACAEGSLTFEVPRGRATFVQIGGIDDTSGQLQFQFECTGACPDTGQHGGGGGIVGPDTGNGGYRRR